MSSRLVSVGSTDYVRVGYYAANAANIVFPGTLSSIYEGNASRAETIFSYCNKLANVLRKFELQLPSHMQQIDVDPSNIEAEVFNATSYSQVEAVFFSKGTPSTSFTVWERFYRFQPIDYPDIEIYLKISCKIHEYTASYLASRSVPKLTIEAGTSLDALTGTLGGTFLSRMWTNLYNQTTVSSNWANGSLTGGAFSVLIKDNSIIFLPPVVPLIGTPSNVRTVFYKNVAVPNNNVVTYAGGYLSPIYIGVGELNTGPLMLNIPVGAAGVIANAAHDGTSALRLGAWVGTSPGTYITPYQAPVICGEGIPEQTFSIPKVPKPVGINPIIVNGRPVMMPLHVINADSSVLTFTDLFFLYDPNPTDYSAGIKNLTVGDESIKGYHCMNCLGMSDTGAEGDRGSVSLFVTMDADYDTYTYPEI